MIINIAINDLAPVQKYDNKSGYLKQIGNLLLPSETLKLAS